MTKLRVVREASTMNPSPGRASSQRPLAPARGPVTPLLKRHNWIHVQPAQDTHYHHNISTQKNFQGRLPPFSVPGSYTLNQQHKPQNAGSSPGVSQQWAFCGPSISELHEKYRMTFRPIIVRHGRLAGWGPTYE